MLLKDPEGLLTHSTAKAVRSRTKLNPVAQGLPPSAVCRGPVLSVVTGGEGRGSGRTQTRRRHSGSTEDPASGLRRQPCHLPRRAAARTEDGVGRAPRAGDRKGKLALLWDKRKTWFRASANRKVKQGGFTSQKLAPHLTRGAWPRGTTQPTPCSACSTSAVLIAQALSGASASAILPEQHSSLLTGKCATGRQSPSNKSQSCDYLKGATAWAVPKRSKQE